MERIGDQIILFAFLNVSRFLFAFFLTGRYLKRTFYWLIFGNLGFWSFFVLNDIRISRGYFINQEIFYWVILLPIIILGFRLERFIVKKRGPSPKLRTKTETNLLPEKNGLYQLPLHQKAKMKWYFHFLYGVIEVMFLAFIAASIVLPGPSSETAFLVITFSTLFIIFGYLWSAIGFFRKLYITITHDHLEYKWLFGHKIVYWTQIQQVEFLRWQGGTFLGIADNHPSRSFWEKTNRMLGVNYSIRIPVSMFSTVDFEKLKATIVAKIKEYASSNP